MMTESLDVLVTGGTGEIGRMVVPALLARGHRVRVLARQASMPRVPAGAIGVVGDALDADSVAAVLRPAETVVHLLGALHPNPLKAREFQRVDLASIQATVVAGQRIGIAHLVYVSVAQPAPVMRIYLAVRAMGEAMIKQANLTATILRPWFVLGPGRRWLLMLTPLYKLAELLPWAEESAQRLGLVTMEQMAKALVAAVENPPRKGDRRVLDVPAIKQAASRQG